MRRYDVLLMDADETLFDFHRSEQEALQKALKDCGILATPSLIALYSRINDGLWKEFEKGLVTKPFLKEARFIRLFEQAGLSGDPLKACERYPYYLGEASYLLDGAEALCRQLVAMGCTIYLTTNGISQVQHRRLEKAPLRDCIADIFVSEDSGFQKPQREYYDYVFRHLPDVDHRRVLAIGDSLSSDIQGGIHAGLDTCWLNWKGAESGSLKPTYTISSLREMPGVIEPGCQAAW